MQFSSIWPIDRALSGATTMGQSGPESNGNEVVLHIRQSITGTSPSNCLMSYLEHSLRGLTPLQRCGWCILQPQPTELNVKTVLFQVIQFSISMRFKCQNSSILNNSVEHKYALWMQKNSKLSKLWFSSIWPIDRTQSDATTLGQSGLGSDGNKGVFHIPESSSLIGTLPSDCLVSYYQDTQRGLTLLLRCRRCILQLQLTGQLIFFFLR